VTSIIWQAASIHMSIVLHHTATQCNTLQHVKIWAYVSLVISIRYGEQLHPGPAATHCNSNTLQHNAAHCQTLQHTKIGAYISIVKCRAAATYSCCNTLQRQHTATATHRNSNTLQQQQYLFSDIHKMSRSFNLVLLQHTATATHCNTLQHTTPHNNTSPVTSIRCRAASTQVPVVASKNV